MLIFQTSSSCQEKYTLNSWGWLNVSHGDGPKFCEAGGCGDHTRVVLLCLYEVKKDYKFANNATIQDLNDTINSGCNSPQGNPRSMNSPRFNYISLCTKNLTLNNNNFFIQGLLESANTILLMGSDYTQLQFSQQ